MPMRDAEPHLGHRTQALGAVPACRRKETTGKPQGLCGVQDAPEGCGHPAPACRTPGVSWGGPWPVSTMKEALVLHEPGCPCPAHSGQLGVLSSPGGAPTSVRITPLEKPLSPLTSQLTHPPSHHKAHPPTHGLAGSVLGGSAREQVCSLRPQCLHGNKGGGQMEGSERSPTCGGFPPWPQ